MSSQRGNVNKKGPPKHQNRRVFKNNLHDTSIKTKQMIDLEVSGVCEKCKEIVDWKIKYKKYKPLTIPKKCVKCFEKTVKRAYYIMCRNCATSLNICAKCGEQKELVLKHGEDPSHEEHQQNELQSFELRSLSERKRRTFLRMQEKGDADLTANDPDHSCSSDKEQEMNSSLNGGAQDSFAIAQELERSDIACNDSPQSEAEAHQTA